MPPSRGERGAKDLNEMCGTPYEVFPYICKRLALDTRMCSWLLMVQVQDASRMQEMRVIIAIVLNLVMSLIYLLAMCLMNRLAPIAHPNVAYGLTMVVWTIMLFAIQSLLLLLLFWSKRKFVFFIPLIIPAVYGLSLLDVYPKRFFVWLFVLLVLYTLYYTILMKNIFSNGKRS